VRHSFTYTPDAAKGTAMLGNTPDAFGQIWNLPTDANAMTIQEWSDLVADSLGVARKPVSVLPTWLVRIIGVFVPVMREFPEIGPMLGSIRSMD